MYSSKSILLSSWFLPIRILLSGLYFIVITLRNYFYNSGIFKIHKIETPVISVGNISAGGSGKTILVQSLLEYFLNQNRKPAVLSRGYGRSTSGLFLVADENALIGDPKSSGDEPFLIAKNHPGIPIVVSENRVIGARYLEDEFHPDVIILDDGFQHRRLYRDLDLILIDQPENRRGHLIPWGYLREPFSNQNRADLIIYSKGGLREKASSNLIISLEDRVFDHSGNTLSLDELTGDYGVFAGLGNPDYFFKSIQEHHYTPLTRISFPDHAEYNLDERGVIAEPGCAYWLTTQKDFIKLDAEFCQQHNIYYIALQTRLPIALIDQLKQNFNWSSATPNAPSGHK